MNPQRSRLPYLAVAALCALVTACTNAPARVEPTAVSTSVSTPTATASPAPTATVPPSASATPTPSPKPSATAAPSAVGFTVQQLMLPLADLPLSGYKIGRDDGTTDHWSRSFDSLAPDAADY